MILESHSTGEKLMAAREIKSQDTKRHRVLYFVYTRDLWRLHSRS